MSYLKGELVLFLISEQPNFGRHIAKIVLHKCYGGIEFGPNSFLVVVGLLIFAIVTMSEMRKKF